MESLEEEYKWELIFINDGSTDDSGELAEAFSKTRDNVRVYHHITNFGLGQTFKFAFRHCKGDYIVTLDIDLSYSPEHIKRLLHKIRETKAKIVLASPYMKGGKISNVPWLRQIMPEMIYKAMILRARIEEVPAHLDWRLQLAVRKERRSSMKLMHHVFSTLLSGFIFRPFMFFILPGLALLLFAVNVNTWMVIHFIDQFQDLPQYTAFLPRASAAVAAAYKGSPHTFIIGLLSLMLAIQLISLGILALQSKKYFEEIFYLGSTMYKPNQERQEEKG
jgi:glycosyltransferase involved in cell wall biosynthesis